MADLHQLERLLEASSDPHNGDADHIRGILEATSRIAVVGFSRDPTKFARRIPSYLAAHDYDVIPVNPLADRILGKKARKSLADVDEPVDLVLLFRPSERVGPFVREAAQRPEKPVIWLQEGIRSDAEAKAARDGGSQVVQDLCIYKVHRALAESPSAG